MCLSDALWFMFAGIVGFICFCIYSSCTAEQPNSSIYYTMEQNQHTIQQTNIVVECQKPRKPTLGECILAPVDLVIGVCNGVIQGIGYGAAYVADTCTIHRLYPEDDHCVHCDLHIDRYHKCKYKK